MNLRSVHLNTRKPTAKVMREIIRHVRFSINPGIFAYMAMSLKYVTKWYIVECLSRLHPIGEKRYW